MADIRRRINNQLDDWEAKRHGMLVKDTISTAEALLSAARGDETDEQRTQTFARHILQGKLCTVVWYYLTKCKKGVILLSDATDEKSGDLEEAVLHSKYLDVPPYAVKELKEYAKLPGAPW